MANPKASSNIQSIYPLTSMQEGMLFHILKGEVNNAYFGQSIFELKGKIDVVKFEESIREVARRHEIFRTRIIYQKLEKPVQVVLKETAITIIYKQFLEAKTEQEKVLEAERYINCDRQNEFNLSNESLIRFSLLELSEAHYILLWSFNHIILDGWCIGVLAKDLFNIYFSKVNHAPLKLESIVPYKNYIDWVARQDKEEALAYWKRYLQNYEEVTTLPMQNSSDSYKHSEWLSVIEGGLYDKLVEVTKYTRVTMNILFQAVWGILLQRYNYTEDAVFGAVVSGRPTQLKGVERMIGLLINTLPVRVKCSGDMKVSELINSLQQEYFESEKYAYTSLVDIQKETGLGNQLITHIIAYENYPIESALKSLAKDSLNIEQKGLFEQTSYDFFIDVTQTNKLEIHFVYNENKYSLKWIKQVAAQIRQVMEQIVCNVDILIKDLKVLTSTGKDAILYNFNHTKVEAGLEKSVVEIFKQTADVYRNKVAITYGQQKLTYKDLDEKSDQLAAVLIKKGVRAGEVVGLLADRSIEMIIGVVAILKAGGAYLPIDPKYPQNRKEYMLEDANVHFVLTMSDSKEHEMLDRQVIYLNDEAVYTHGYETKEVKQDGDALAYIMYTSGTTNKPKGVMIPHKGITRLVKNTGFITFQEDDQILQTGSVVFDASTFEIWSVLLNGMQLHLVDQDILLNAKRLKQVLLEEEITILWLTAALFNQLVEEDIEMFGKLRYLLVGGDVLSCKHINSVLERYPNINIINGYGPTENTTFSTTFKIDKKYVQSIPIGKPITNSTAYIVDQYGNLQDLLMPGELWVGGAGVAQGYLNSKELTDKKFIQSPFNGRERLYKTGDLVKWGPDGNIEFIGRLDTQVKIRGFRVDLTEVESYILKIPYIKQAVIKAFDEGNNNKMLCAYVVSSKSVEGEEIKALLRKEVPYYMVPATIIQLSQLPLTNNGKVDKSKLEKPIITATHNHYAVPATRLEEVWAKLWCEVLGITKVGITDNFFELGGDSIKAMKLIARASKLGMNISLGSLYDHPTISEIIQEEKNGAVHQVVFKNYEADWAHLYEPFPLNEIQMAYMMGRNTQFELGGFSTHYYTEIETTLDMQILNNSLNKLIERHPMLRAVIGENGHQKILSEIPIYKMVIEDLTNLSKEEIENRLLEEQKRMSHQVFDVTKWPVFELKAFKVAEGKYQLAFSVDILIIDGASFFIVARELSQLCENPEEQLEPIDFSFRDYTLALREFKETEEFNVSKEYWMKQIETFPSAPILPLKRDPMEIRMPRFKRLSHTIPKAKWETIKALSKGHNITPAGLLCAAYSTVLSFWSNQSHFAINLTVFNRYPFHKDVLKLVGDFTSIILLDVALEEKTGFWKNAELVQKSLVTALEHRYFDGVEFIRELSKYHNMGTKAIMPVVFTCALFEGQEHSWRKLGNVKMATSQTPQVYLDNQVTEIDGELSIVWDFPEQLYDEVTIEAMFNQYVDIVASIGEETIKMPSISLRDENILQAYNETQKKMKEDTLCGLFMEQVNRVPEQVAIICEEQQITYKELNKKANQVANFLIEKGLQGNANVGVIGDRNLNTIINILGILKAGGAYVPINADFSNERCEYILKDSKCMMRLNKESYEKNNISQYSQEEVNSRVTDNLVAYIIYTSGSTGKPKGVVIEDKAAVNTILDINERFNVTEEDKIIGLSSMCFDLSVYDIFGALSTGATLIMVKDQRNVKEVVDVLINHKITFWNSVPAIMDMVVESLPEDFSNIHLKHVLLSGDWIPLNLPHKINQYFKSAQVISLGGATEASIWSIYYEIKEVKKEWNSIPYGMPLSNQKFYVLNYEEEECPVGVIGELYIGGIGVAKEYINDEVKTAAAFINHPRFGRIYKTGDYGRMHEEGYIEFLGRRDSQVKIRGYRIEFGEIEAALNEHEYIGDAVVDVYQLQNGAKQLIGYIKPEEKKNKPKRTISYTELENKVKDNICSYSGEISIDDLASANEKLEEISTAYIYRSLKQLHIEDYAKQEIGYEALAQMCNIEVQYYKLFRSWLNMLVEDKILECVSEDRVILVKPIPEYNLAGLWEFFKQYEEIEDIRESLSYMKLSGDNHIRMLQGEINPLTLFFPKGSTNTATSMYKFNPIIKFINNIVAMSLKDIISKWHKDRKIRILEVGAGTGGTTAYVLPILNPECVEYTFTDLSTFFTEEAARNYSEYGFIKYGILDINEEMQAQGYEYGYYDIIIGANVLHDARNLNVTLEYLKTLMSDEGTLLILEGTKNIRQHSASVGFIEGLSHFEDERVETNKPLLSVEKWKDYLEKHQFSNFKAFPEGERLSNIFNNHVMIATLDAQKEIVTEEELKEFLALKVPEYMIPNRFMVINQIPISTNGKINRKALPKPSDSSIHQKQCVKPKNATQKKLVEIWQEVLGLSEVGITDDFFEIGGDSLKAIRLVAKAEEKNIKLSLVHILTYLTIEKIEPLVNTEGVLGEEDNLILEKRGKDLTKHIFLIHGGTGEVGCFRYLSKQLDDEYSVWALRYPYEDKGVRNITIEDIAKTYTERIVQIQKNGPYNLGGWCSGGVIVYEIARQLEARGECVNTLILIDAEPPEEDKVAEAVKFNAETEAYYLKQILPPEEVEEILRDNDLEEIWKKAIKYLEENQVDKNELLKLMPSTISRVIPQTDIDCYASLVMYANRIRTLVNAKDFYAPATRLKTDMMFFSGIEEPMLNRDIWRAYSESGYICHMVPGNHITMFDEENVCNLSRAINEILK